MHVHVHAQVQLLVQVCTRMTCCWKLNMAAILHFAIEVGYEGFSVFQVLCTYVQVQVRMHVCIHLHTRACIHTHSGTVTGAGMYMHDVLLEA